MLVRSCYVSQGVAVRTVSIGKSDLQGHSRALALVPFDRPLTISYQSSIATMSLSCTVNEIFSLISQTLKKSRNSDHMLFGDNNINVKKLQFIHTVNGDGPKTAKIIKRQC